VTILWDAAWKYLEDRELFYRPIRDRATNLQQMLDVVTLLCETEAVEDGLGSELHLALEKGQP
jgi:hypothetical protein